MFPVPRQDNTRRGAFEGERKQSLRLEGLRGLGDAFADLTLADARRVVKALDADRSNSIDLTELRAFALAARLSSQLSANVSPWSCPWYRSPAARLFANHCCAPP